VLAIFSHFRISLILEDKALSCPLEWSPVMYSTQVGSRLSISLNKLVFNWTCSCQLHLNPIAINYLCRITIRADYYRKKRECKYLLPLVSGIATKSKALPRPTSTTTRCTSTSNPNLELPSASRSGSSSTC
jgi:hypothetical protein